MLSNLLALANTAVCRVTAAMISPIAVVLMSSVTVAMMLCIAVASLSTIAAAIARVATLVTALVTTRARTPVITRAATPAPANAAVTVTITITSAITATIPETVPATVPAAAPTTFPTTVPAAVPAAVPATPTTTILALLPFLPFFLFFLLWVLILLVLRPPYILLDAVPRRAYGIEVDPHQRICDHDVVRELIPLKLFIARSPNLKGILQVFDAFNLGYPCAGVPSSSVIIKSLFDRVEDAIVGSRVIADSGSVLPVAPVGPNVVVDQIGFVPLGSVAPVNLEILGQETCHDLPGPVGSVTGVVQLPLRSVDETQPCPTLEEAVEHHLDSLGGWLLVSCCRELIRGFPNPVILLAFRRRPEAFEAEHLLPPLHAAETHVVPPEQFESNSSRSRILALAKAIRICVLRVLAVFKFHHLLVYLTSCEAAQGKIARKLSAIIFAE